MVTLTFTKIEEIDDWIINNIIQNDARYDMDPGGRQILSFFILNKGIMIKEKYILSKAIETISKEKNILDDISLNKSITYILKKNGFF